LFFGWLGNKFCAKSAMNFGQSDELGESLGKGLRAGAGVVAEKSQA